MLESGLERKTGDAALASAASLSYNDLNNPDDIKALFATFKTDLFFSSPYDGFTITIEPYVAGVLLSIVASLFEFVISKSRNRNGHKIKMRRKNRKTSV